ncbi:hypothetical protein [Moraxella lacunata]
MLTYQLQILTFNTLRPTSGRNDRNITHGLISTKTFCTGILHNS